MTTKDHLCLSLPKNDHVNGISSSFSKQNGYQYSNLNLNANQKCSSILETFQSNKSISTSSNSKNNNYENAVTITKVVDEINFGKSENKLSAWNKTDTGKISSNNSSKIGETSKKWKSSNPNSKKSSSSNNSTLSIHITAYENSIEARNELNSSVTKNDGTNSSNRKINKVLEVLKTGFASMDAFEIPRQQTTEGTNEPEIMGFKASQKLQNSNQSSGASSKPDSFIGHEVETRKNNYAIKRDIKKGRMSKVYEVRRSKDSKVLAMKVYQTPENAKATPTLLRHEAHIYHELSVLSRHIPKEEIRFLNLYDYGECADGQFLFLTLGGESLDDFMTKVKVPSYQTALDLSYQMLHAIEQIHHLGLIHSRIRPQTFITGSKPRERLTLFIINFSLAKMANPTKVEGDTPAVNRIPPQIFDRYAPRCQHLGLPYHRKDDLESWFYICCDLFHPHFLPWSSDKRLKSPQMAELKDKLMKGELYYRYAVMPKPFQAIAGAINETDAKVPNYTFFKECLTDEAKSKNCVLFSAWEFIPVASLPPVPEAQTQTRIEFEFNQCIKSPTTCNFGSDKSRIVLPDDGKELAEQSSDAQSVVQSSKSKLSVSPSKRSANTNSDGTRKADAKTTKKNESVTISMSDAMKTLGTESGSDSSSGSGSDLETDSNISATKDSDSSNPEVAPAAPTLTAASDSDTKPLATKDSKNSETKDTKPKLAAVAATKEKLENESKPPTDASSDEEEDEEEEEVFKLKSPPANIPMKACSPKLQTRQKRSPAKEFKPSPSSSSTTTGTSGSSTSGTFTSESGISTSGTETSSGASATSSGASLPTSFTTSTAVGGYFKNVPPSSSGSDSSNPSTPPPKIIKATNTVSSPENINNSRPKKIIATTPAFPNSTSPIPPSPKKKSTPATSACSTASLPPYAKANQHTPQKRDSIDYNSSNPAPNNNDDIQNGSNYPKLSSSQVRTFQNHKNDSIYFGVPVDAPSTPPANTSGYLKPQPQDSTTPKMNNNDNNNQPSSTLTKNQSAYFAPK